ncbi:hypothetical protein TCON_1594 [Astathelohania contejeani]|uniref:HRDC domain-containing protein n=1 Tax=Astathelohania contejeani TaxID=164912 RepID=A0ABQ7HYK6_9MICR|nr:hypothetical protein TCON_1594 [Thelohania contejeani]
MEKIKMGSNLIKLINQNMFKISQEYYENPSKHSQILELLDTLIIDTSPIEDRISLFYNLFENVDGSEDKTHQIKIFKGGKLIAILPNTGKTDNSELLIRNKFNKNVISNLELLRCFDRRIKSEMVYIKVYESIYMSYEGTPSLMVVKTGTCDEIIIDCTVLKDISTFISKWCSKRVILHCQLCAEVINRTYGLNLKYLCLENIHKDTIWVDWSIRPVTQDMIDVIKRRTQYEYIKIKDNQFNKVGNSLNWDEHKGYEISIDEIIKKYSVDDIELLKKLLKLREFISKENNVSLSYVMSDGDLVKLTVEKPICLDALSECFLRMSPVTRIHSSDILLTIKSDEKLFSVEDLKKNKAIKEMNIEYISTQASNMEEKRNGKNTETELYDEWRKCGDKIEIESEKEKKIKEEVKIDDLPKEMKLTVKKFNEDKKRKPKSKGDSSKKINKN